MIENPVVLVALFALLVAAILATSKARATSFLFKYLPVPLWCYFIPTLLSTFRVIPSEAPLYGQMSRTLLPACLFLLLLGADLPAIFRLSRKAVGAMLAGTAGIFLGGIATFLVFSRVLKGAAQSEDLWKGWGSLGATWIGGSANMIAVREILLTPESLFSNLVLTDTVIAYSWMAVLVSLSQHQAKIDRWLGAEAVFAGDTAGDEAGPRADPLISVKSVLLALAAFGFSWLCWRAAQSLPELGRILNRSGWAVILATFVPLLLSLTPLRRLADRSVDFAGNFLLFVLLTSIGARANLTALGLAPWFILAGLFWMTLHGLTLAAYGKWTRTPIALLAAASQANVGGPISAPLVATIYRRELATLAVLLAVLGNIYGTYAGLLLAEICRALTDMI